MVRKIGIHTYSIHYKEGSKKEPTKRKKRKEKEGFALPIHLHLFYIYLYKLFGRVSHLFLGLITKNLELFRNF